MTQQEGVLVEIFNGHIGRGIDIGANDGLFLSNTFHLEQLGWEILCVEANPLYAGDLYKNRKHTLSCAVGEVDNDDVIFNLHVSGNNKYASMSGLASTTIPAFSREPHTELRVAQLSLNSILFKWGDVDFIAMDVEGGEEGILRGLDFNLHKPKVIMYESIYSNPCNLLQANGYRLHSNIGDDAIMVLDATT